MEHLLSNQDESIRIQTLESDNTQSRIMTHSNSVPSSFQRRTVEGARNLRDNLTSVIREMQPFVETARTVGVQSAMTILNRPTIQNDSPDISTTTNNINDNNNEVNSFVINVDEGTPNENDPTNNEIRNETNPERLQTIIDAQIMSQVLLKYVPFLIILLIKALFDYHDGIIGLLVLIMVFAHSNDTVIKEATKRHRRDILHLFVEVFYIFVCIFCVLFFIIGDFKVLLNLTIFREFDKPLNLSYLLWIIIITDFLLKLITVTIKIFLTMFPAAIIAFQERGKVYLFVEALSQLYRSLATIQPWLSYLLESYEGVGKILSVFLSAFYMISKGTDLLARVKLLRQAFQKLLLSRSVGTSPTKEQIQTAGEHCPICHDEYDAPVLLQCRHIFCENCVSTWFDREQTCPLCRAKIVDDPSWRDGSTSYFIQLY